jgi:UMF1 family MFS transporter
MPDSSEADNEEKVAVVPSPMAAVAAAAAATPAAVLGGEEDGEAAAEERVGWCWCCVRAPPFSAAHPPLSKRELFSWFMYDWANSACSSVVISGFLPLLTQDSALGAAGFPRICPNVIRNATLIAAAGFAAKPFEYSDGMAMYRVTATDAALLPDSRCVAATGAFGAGAVGSVCPNFPSISDLCLHWPPPAAGGDADVFGLFVKDAVGTNWVPAAYTNSMNSLSTGLCILVFIACSAFADYGPYRRSLFVAISTLGSIFCIMALGIRPASWQLGGVVMVFTTILYSTSYVFYNAWLPLLAGNDPATLKAPKDRVEEVFQARMHDISSRGYYWGYFGSVLCLVVCLIIVIGMSATAENNIVPFSVCVAFAGLWWMGFASSTTFRFVQPRPGPPLPVGESYVIYPFKRMFRTAQAAGTMPETLKFLLAWFMFSDGFNTISSVGAIYANTSVTYDGIGKGIGITLLLLIVPLFAGIGGIFWNWVHATGRLTAKQIIVANCVLMTLTPAYGLLGFADSRLGYRRWWELYLGVIFYGLNLGSVQSFSRSTFGSMIPEGMEANMYALYNVTDRGSSWIGPGVVAAILSATGNIRYAFLYPIGMLLVPMALLYFVDVQRGVRMAANYAVANKTAAVAGSRGAVSLLSAAATPVEAESAELLQA